MLPVLVLALALTGAVSAQDLPPSGPYGFLLNWSFSDPTINGGIAILGVANFDGAGNVSGPYTLQLGSGGGQTQSTTTGTFSGTYSSVPVVPGGTGGTGSMTIAFDAGFTLELEMVIVDDGHGLDLIATGCPGGGCGLHGAVVSGVARHTKKHLTLADLQGSYGIQFTFSPQAFRGLSVAGFNGGGSVITSGTGVGAGLNVITFGSTGTYAVNSDGTGTITLDAIPGVQGVQTLLFVITDGGSGILLLQINRAGDGVSTGIARLQ